MLRFALVFLIFTVVSCATEDPDLDLPIAEDTITLLVFCNNTDVKCTDLQYIPEYVDNTFGDEISTASVFVDSPRGREISDTLEISDIPSYVIFRPSGEEAYRALGEINIETIGEQITILLTE